MLSDEDWSLLLWMFFLFGGLGFVMYVRAGLRSDARALAARRENRTLNHHAWVLAMRAQFLRDQVAARHLDDRGSADWPTVAFVTGIVLVTLWVLGSLIGGSDPCC